MKEFEIIDRLNLSFNTMLEEYSHKSTTDYLIIFNAIVSWVDQNKEYFKGYIKENDRLDILLKIDPEKYLLIKPDMPLAGIISNKNNFRHSVDSLTMIISDILWPLICIPTGKDCLIHSEYELLYKIAVNVETNKREIVRECDYCGYCENLNGGKFIGDIVYMLPANEDDLEKVGIIFDKPVNLYKIKRRI